MGNVAKSAAAGAVVGLLLFAVAHHYAIGSAEIRRGIVPQIPWPAMMLTSLLGGLLGAGLGLKWGPSPMPFAIKVFALGLSTTLGCIVPLSFLVSSLLLKKGGAAVQDFVLLYLVPATVVGWGLIALIVSYRSGRGRSGNHS